MNNRRKLFPLRIDQRTVRGSNKYFFFVLCILCVFIVGNFYWLFLKSHDAKNEFNESPVINDLKYVLTQQERIESIGSPLISKQEMKDKFYDFYKLYQNKPIKSNVGGMGVSHSFALYLILKKIKPTVVIESGVYGGHSTWLFRTVLGPNAKIYSFDPLEYENWKGTFRDNSPNTKYFRGSKFIDISEVDLPIKPSDNVLAFCDDHMPFSNRFYKLYTKYNVTHWIEEDNYPINFGSNYSLRAILNNRFDLVTDRILFGQFGFANVGHSATTISKELHLAMHWFFRSLVSRYQEFPVVKKNYHEFLNYDIPYIFEDDEFRKFLKDFNLLDKDGNWGVSDEIAGPGELTKDALTYDWKQYNMLGYAEFKPSDQVYHK